MRLKLRFPDSTEIVSLSGSDNTDNTVTVKQLLDSPSISSLGSVSIKAGFPPKLVSLNDQNATLKSLGISNGEQLTVLKATSSVNSGVDKLDSEAHSSESSSSTSTSSAQTTRANPAFSRSSANSSNLPQQKPQSQLKSNPLSQSQSRSNPLSQSQPQLQSQSQSKPQPRSQPKDEIIQVKCSSFGYLRLRVMEDDNSCMFRAVGYTILKNLDTMFALRDVVRETILNNPDDYSDAILDKPRDVYMSWICQENSWGGAIELDILAKHFNVTICSLDVASLRTDMFNPGQDRFVIVVYSGIHYDAVALVPMAFESGRPEDDTTIFEGDLRGMQVLESLTELGKLLKNRKYYTDTAAFALKCNTCGAALVGEKDATKHAMATGHTDFGEY